MKGKGKSKGQEKNKMGRDGQVKKKKTFRKEKKEKVLETKN